MLNAADIRLMRQGESARRRWESTLRRGIAESFLGIHPGPAWAFGSDGAPFQTAFGYDRWFAALSRLTRSIRHALGTMSLPRVGWPRGLARRVLLAGGAATVTTLAIASALATKGYVEHPAEFWFSRIAGRMVSPIYDADGTLIGAVDTQGTLTPEQTANLAFIPLHGDVPRTFVKGLLALENKHFYKGGIHNVCGIDLVSLLRPIASLGRAGGSGLVQQLAKQLMLPEWGNETGKLAKGYRWAQQLGASCALYGALTEQGGIDKVVIAYANSAPIWQGNGVLRGLEAASRVVFDLEPASLSNAQQLIFAAAVKEPLRVMPAGATRVECARVYPRADNPQYEEDTAKTQRERTNQCRVLHRAISMAKVTLTSDELVNALEELRAYQRDGIVPVNPFEPISTKKLVNLSSRARAALPDGLLSQIRDEAEESTQPGDSLVVSLDAVRQHAFSQDMKQALDSVQRSPAGRRILCLRLIETEKHGSALRQCGIDKEKKLNADVLAVKTDVRTGGLKAMYASSPLIMDSLQSIGSIAKWVILIAAIADGYRADTVVCPRQAFDGDRPLNRVKAPRQGYANCDGGKHTITFQEATAQSDNLAYYDIAKGLGPQKLAAAAATLGLGDEAAPAELPYALAFGTFGVKPRELIGAAQAMFAVAYEIRVTGRAPRVLTNVTPHPNPSVADLRKMIPTSEQRQALQVLLEAPVEADRGTLGVFSKDVHAGKSGSTSSNAVDSTGHKYAHGKWAVTYQKQLGEINLFMVASPVPSVPLAHHSISASLLAPAHRILLANNQE